MKYYLRFVWKCYVTPGMCNFYTWSIMEYLYPCLKRWIIGNCGLLCVVWVTLLVIGGTENWCAILWSALYTCTSSRSQRQMIEVVCVSHMCDKPVREIV